MNDDEKRFLEQIQKQNEDAHAETRRQFQATADKFAIEHAETRRQFSEFAQAIEQRFDETSRVMRRHFDTVAENITEKTRREIQLLAESLSHVDQKVDADSAKIDRLVADNEVFKAVLLNHDRRLRVVEDIVLPQKSS